MKVEVAFTTPSKFELLIQKARNGILGISNVRVFGKVVAFRFLGFLGFRNFVGFRRIVYNGMNCYLKGKLCAKMRSFDLLFQLFIIIIFSFLTFTWIQVEGNSVIEDKNSASSYKTVRQIWESHKHRFVLDKWMQYADAYEKHLPKPIFHPENAKKDRIEIRLLEIGVQSGGSLIDWKRYYGDNSTIVGILILTLDVVDLTCLMRISLLRLDHNLIKTSYCCKYGPFNIIIDDGGHSAKMIMTSIRIMFPNETCISPVERDSVYAIEDLHTSVMRRYFQNHKEFSHDLFGESFRAMHSRYSETTEESHDSLIFQQYITSVHLYDSIAFFGKGIQTGLDRKIVGKDAFKNNEFKLNPKGAYVYRKKN